MPFITTEDGTEIFYKDWGSGQPIVFSHGWPLSADAWDGQMLALAASGFRCIAHDRRGHGRSSQPWKGNDMDTYADDLAALTNKLDLKNAIHSVHATGGGEGARYIGRHGTKRVAKAVLIGAVPPGMLKTAANPGGLPLEAFDQIRAGVQKDRSQFFKDLTTPFYGANRPGAQVSQGLRDAFWLQGMQVGIKAAYDCIQAFSESEFTPDLEKFDVPTFDHPRRRRSDRPLRRCRATDGKDRQGCPAGGLQGGTARAGPDPDRKGQRRSPGLRPVLKFNNHVCRAILDPDDVCA
jgi:non-heme chloroperoxidase